MTEQYGLTNNGYKTKPFDVMVAEVSQTLTNELGSINLNPPSIFSVLINTFLIEVSKIDLKGEEIYNANYPTTATGYSLDGIADYNGIKRLSPTYSTVTAQLTTVPYTTIPISSEVLIENTNNILLTTNSITINNEQCNSITIEIVDNSYAEYKVIISNVEYTYARELEDTLDQIAEGLKNAITTNQNLTVSRLNNELIISSLDYLVLFSCFLTDGMNIISCTNNMKLQAKELGAISIPQKSVNIINTPITGWLSVDNKTAGITGRNLETDIELRARRIKSIKFSGSGTVESLRAKLLNITGVTSVKIIENVTNSVDINGLPAKSFEALVLGGSDIDIGNIIWRTKPAGIQTHGNTSVEVLDSENKPHLIYFSRSIKLYVFVKLTITKNESFIDDSIVTIKQNIVDNILTKGVGEPVILQSLYGSIYAVEGVTNVILTLGATLIETDIPTYSTNNIDTLPSQIVTTDINKITIDLI